MPNNLLINTPLQRGVRPRVEGFNRFSGFNGPSTARVLRKRLKRSERSSGELSERLRSNLNVT